jgi:hypothetical protein
MNSSSKSPGLNRRQRPHTDSFKPWHPQKTFDFPHKSPSVGNGLTRMLLSRTVDFPRNDLQLAAEHLMPDGQSGMKSV